MCSSLMKSETLIRSWNVDINIGSWHDDNPAFSISEKHIRESLKSIINNIYRYIFFTNK